MKVKKKRKKERMKERMKERRSTMHRYRDESKIIIVSAHNQLSNSDQASRAIDYRGR